MMLISIPVLFKKKQDNNIDCNVTIYIPLQAPDNLINDKLIVLYWASSS